MLQVVGNWELNCVVIIKNPKGSGSLRIKKFGESS